MPEEIPTQIRQLWQQVPVPPPPVEDIITRGRRFRRRHRALLATAAAAGVLAVIGGAGGAAHLVMTGPGVSTAGSAGRAAGLTRQVGFSGLVVRVPASWSLSSGDPRCEEKPTFNFTPTIVGSCFHGPYRIKHPASVLVIGTAATVHVPRGGWTRLVSDAGVSLEQTPVDCTARARFCIQGYRVPGSSTVFRLEVLPRDRELLQTLPATLDRLPAGKVAVPWINVDTPLRQARRTMAAVGLTVVTTVGETGVRETRRTPGTPTVIDSRYAGRIVPKGSTVALGVQYRGPQAGEPHPDPSTCHRVGRNTVVCEGPGRRADGSVVTRPR